MTDKRLLLVAVKTATDLAPLVNKLKLWVPGDWCFITDDILSVLVERDSPAYTLLYLEIGDNIIMDSEHREGGTDDLDEAE